MKHATLVVLVLAFVACRRPAIKPAEEHDASVEKPATTAPVVLGPIPLGHWESDDSVEAGRICLDLEEGRRAKLTTYEGEDGWWAPEVARGAFVDEKNGDGTYKVTMTVESIHRKGISKCRKNVIDAELAKGTYLGEAIEKGKPVELSLKFAEEGRIVDLCVLPAKKCKRLTKR